MSWSNSQKAPLQLHIIVVGCGMGGLAAAHCLAEAGHKITLLESAPEIGEVGAGIQVSPNVSRLLIRWGIGDALEKVAVRPEAIVLRRYATGERVGYTRWGEKMEEYGAPYYHIHRADYHKLLYDLAAPKMTLRLDATVVAVDPEAPSVTLKSGEVVHGDLIVGADGIKSLVQTVVIGKVNPAEPTGDAAYRAVIPADLMLADPELKPFIDTPEMTGWMAPGRHLMAYCIRAKREFNMVLLHPDDGSVESWSAEGSAEKMRKDFADFEPRVQKLLSSVQSTLKWRLMDRQPLETWVHPSGRVTLLGDACHPMLPYRAQGAAMAIEDAAVLGRLFSHIRDRSQMKPLLQAYQALRLQRTAETQASSRLNQKIFHLPDGPAQAARDASMRAAMDAELRMLEREREGKPAALEDTLEGNYNQWADRRKNEMQFGYDAEAVADRWWEEHGEKEIGRLAEKASGRL
ncbi:FAD/NAD-P-binding domain-containing protein [Obba rivulosa]|uniref:FAD/NAD-P-binding domain-containing protein n=1 Tax=Obba rivulosa TaxID=1052685 RepID=A0A8E2AS22_9APHY|nr:FAD/NAD-P-binding domain-containing protein [Obba rivulosa]